MPREYHARVLFAFQAENDSHLTLCKGETVRVTPIDDGNGWSHGIAADGREGFFPADYVEALEADAGDVAVAVQADSAADDGGPILRRKSRATSSVHWSKPTDLYVETASYDDDDAAPAAPAAPAASTAADTARLQVASDSHTRYGIYASNMALGCALGMVLTGVGALWWVFADDHYGVGTALVGIYSIAAGVCVYLFERERMHVRSGSKRPLRAAAYLAVSGPLFCTTPTLFAGVCLIFVAAFQAVSAAAGERYSVPDGMTAHEMGVTLTGLAARLGCDACPCSGASGGARRGTLREWWAKKKDQNRTGIIVFLTAYLIVSVVVFVYVYAQWVGRVNDMPSDARFSQWVPLAKAAGASLNLNSALILLPVCRTVLRWLYDRSTSDQRLATRALRAILVVVPLDHALEFHALCGWMLVLHTFIHVVAHVVNYVYAKALVDSIFGATVFVSGGLLFIVMMLIYGAVTRSVKSTHFELFWYSHNVLFPLYYLAAMLHGKGTFGPNFWKFALGPLVLYAGDRAYREWNSRRPVRVISVTHMDGGVNENGVFALELAKEGALASYKEGQYIFVKSEHVSRHEWHPFTISSAPNAETATLHIRSMGSGSSSWTGGLQSYLRLLGPPSSQYYPINKTHGPDGSKLISVVGPLAAPTQHVAEYHTVLLVTSGIGVTPLAASISSIVHHRWRFSIGQAYPDHVRCHWVIPHREVDSFRWFIRTVKEAADAVADMRAKDSSTMAARTFAVSLYVTSVSGDTGRVPAPGAGEEADVAFWGRRRADAHNVQHTGVDWTELDLYRALKQPSDEPRRFSENVAVFKGRPQWAPVFESIDAVATDNDVGVLFCGNPGIRKQLAVEIEKLNAASKGSRRSVRLHAEVF